MSHVRVTGERGWSVACVLHTQVGALFCLGRGNQSSFMSSKNNYMLSKQFSPLFSERTNTNLGKPIGKKEGEAQDLRLKGFSISSPEQDTTAFPV